MFFRVQLYYAQGEYLYNEIPLVRDLVAMRLDSYAAVPTHALSSPALSSPAFHVQTKHPLAAGTVCPGNSDPT